MKFSLNWIQDFIDVSEFLKKPEELAQILTQAGLEVEGWEGCAELPYVVIGHIEKLEKHPDADKLTLCQVKVGEGDVRSIVCGAKNHKQGDKVVAALVGAVLPGDFKIKKSKIRGVESEGMLCSVSELGLAKSSEGIMILDSLAPVGESYWDYGKHADWVFEVNVTPNRADCLSHWGLAKELSCLLNKKLTPPKVEVKKEQLVAVNLPKVSIKADKHCPRYALAAAQGLEVGESPEWIKNRLEKVGLNPKNNLVDITNYVMMEVGQPLHAFDASEIQGNEIVIELSKEHENFETLDGQKLELTGQELMIRDSKKNLALAGIMGGLNSGVQDSTKSIYIESAYFKPGSVRKSARRFGIQSDSSYRFTRGTDPESVLMGIQRASYLYASLGAKLSSDVTDIYPKAVEAKEIEVDLIKLNRRLGLDVSSVGFEDWCSRLRFKILDHNKETSIYKVLPPLDRQDMIYFEDVVEEMGRLEGYDNIPEVLPAMNEGITSDESEFTQEQVLADKIIRTGAKECYYYQFDSSKNLSELSLGKNELNSLGLFDSGEFVSLQNPLNEDMNIMRPSLLPQMFSSILKSQKRNIEKSYLFEIGSVFSQVEKSYKQSGRLCFGLWNHGSELHNVSVEPVLQLKAKLEEVFQALGLKSWSWRSLKSESTFFHPGQSVELIFQGKPAGVLGSVHPKWVEQFDGKPLALAEFKLDPFLSLVKRKVVFKGFVSDYPGVERDMTVLVPKGESVELVSKALSKNAQPYLEKLWVTDVFDKGDKGKSVSYRLRLSSKDKTLTDDELLPIQKKIEKACLELFNSP